MYRSLHVPILAAAVLAAGCIVNPVPTPGETGGAGGGSATDPTLSSDVGVTDTGGTDTGTRPTDDLDAGQAGGGSDTGSGSSSGADAGGSSSSGADAGGSSSGGGLDTAAMQDAAPVEDAGSAGGSSNDAVSATDAATATGPDAACAAALKSGCTLGVALLCHPQHANWTDGPCKSFAQSAIACLAGGKSCGSCGNALKALRQCAWKPTTCSNTGGGGGGGGGSGGGGMQTCMAFKTCTSGQLQVQCNNSGCTCTIGSKKLLEWPPVTNMCKSSQDLLAGPCTKAVTTLPSDACKDNGDCLLTEACVIAKCGEKGHCAPKGMCPSNPTAKPVCGCNGKTQLDACNAMWTKGAGVKAAGACP